MLDDEGAALLLDRLLLWLIRLVQAGEGPLVIRKLCTALVAYFLRPEASWKHCIRHIACCFAAGDVSSGHILSQSTPMATVIEGLNQAQLVTTMWFAAGLVEEVGKTDSSSIQK